MKSRGGLSVASDGRLVFLLLAAVCLGGCDSGTGDGNAGAEERETSGSTHEHAEPGETCFICDASQRDPDRLWCEEHGRYEDRCWICHPDLQDRERLYCEEHGLYEDECFLCHPELALNALERPGGSIQKERTSSEALFCREHRVPELECGICQPQLAADLRPGDNLKIRFESPLSARKAGIRVAPPRLTDEQRSIRGFCEVRYDEHTLARITPLAPGVVRRVLRDVGSLVKERDTLVEIHSLDVASAKSAFLSARVDHQLKEIAYQRERRLADKKVSAKREYQEAEAASKTAELRLHTARQRLLNYGFTDSEITELERARDSSALLPVRAPYDGTLVARHAVVGEAVEPGHELFRLADLSRMWLELSVPSDQIGLLEAGLKVEAVFADLPGLVAQGSILWVDTSIDDRTRMVQACAVVPNVEGKLKAGLFGEARILLGDASRALYVPKSAVQRLGSRTYVFVRVEEDLFALRRVVVGMRTDDSVEVVTGLQPDEPVVVRGSFTVLSEFLKSRLGAGCVDD